MKNKKTSYIYNIVFITMPVFIIIIVIFELIIRIYFKDKFPPNVHWDDQYKIIKYDNNNSVSGFRSYGEFGQFKAHWKINNEGWNSPINYYEKKTNKIKRIAIIGDSYVEALQIDIDSSFCNKLSIKLRDQYEVYSFGFSGSPLSQYLNLARYVEKKFNPDIYLILLIHNDFDESYKNTYTSSTSSDYFLKIDAKNNFTEIPPIPYEAGWFKKALKKLYLAKYLVYNFKIKERLNYAISSKDNKTIESTNYWDYMYRDWCLLKHTTSVLLDKIKALTGNKEVVFLMDAPRLDIYNENMSNSRAFKLNRLVDTLTKEKGLHFIDLTYHFEKDYKANRKKYETNYDYHWSYYAHNYVSEILYDRFVKGKNKIIFK